MSRTVAAHIHKDKAFAKMIHVFTSTCHKDGFHPPAAITEELFYKIGRPGATLVHTSLSFHDCNIDDQVMSYLLDAVAVYPVVESIDLSQNAISDVGARYLLKLLRAQANLVKNVHVDKRLYATFISHVDLTDNYESISPHVSDEIEMMCEALHYANIQTSVRKAFLNNGCRHHVSDSSIKGVWDDVIKEQFPGLEAQVEEQQYVTNHYATGIHQHSHSRKRPTSPGRSVGSSSLYNNTSIHSIQSSVSSRLPTAIAEVAVMRALQAAERVPYLTRWQYNLVAVPELRNDESFSDKSVLYASTVFEQMDSLSVSSSNIAFSPVSKTKKAPSLDTSSIAPVESNAERLYRIIDKGNKGYFTAKELQAALESSEDIVEAFMLYMSGDVSHDRDDLSTLESASLFSMPDESKSLVRLMDIKNTGRVEKADFLAFVSKSAIAVGNNLTMKDLSESGYENTSPNQSQSDKKVMHPLSVTFSDAGTFQGGNSAYTGEYSPCRSGSHDTTSLVSNMMQAFLDRIRYMGKKEKLEELTTFAYDKEKEDEIVRQKQDKALYFCKEYFDASGTEMSTLAIPRSLEFGEYNQLRVLCLRDNSMSTVDGSALCQLPKLRVLDLSHNLIEKIGGKSFPKSLRVLNLSYNLLQTTSFSPLIQSVVDLNLAGNEICSVDILPRKVAKLNIADNRISTVMSLRVMALHAITSLTLTGNPIVESTKYLKATVSSLFPHLEELDGAMLPRRVNSRIVRRASSTMSLSILGESRGRVQMTSTYQKQLDKKRSEEFKVREELRREKLQEYVKSFTVKMRRRATSPQKLEKIVDRLYNGKHNSMSHIRGRSPRAGSVDSTRDHGESGPRRNRLSLSPSKIKKLTERLYRGSHHRVHMGPPPEHPSSPRKYTGRSTVPSFSPQRKVERGRSADAVRLSMPASRSFSPTEEDSIEPIGGRFVSKSDDLNDDSFMNRPPSFKKQPVKTIATVDNEAVPTIDFSKRIKQMLNQFVSAVSAANSAKVSEHIVTKIHDIAGSIDNYLSPFVGSLEELDIDGVLGIAESPGNFAFHQMTDGEKEAHCARWVASQVAACIRSAEDEIESIGNDGNDEQNEETSNTTSHPFSECVHMASSMSPFLKENPVNWMFCASVLRRVESRRYPGRKLATYVYSVKPVDVGESIAEAAVDAASYDSLDTFDVDKKVETAKDSKQASEKPLDEALNVSDPVSNKTNEIEEVRDHLSHITPNVSIVQPSLPTPPDDHTLTAKKGIELFERSSSTVVDNSKDEKAPQDSSAERLQSSFIDTENEVVGSPPIIPRRRSKSNTSLPVGSEDLSPSPLREASSPIRATDAVSVSSLKSIKDEGVSLRSVVNPNLETPTERPSSRNSIHSNATDDQAAGDVFSRMNSLKSRISISSTPVARCNTSDSQDDVKSHHSMPDESSTVPEKVPDASIEEPEESKMILDAPVDIEEPEIPNDDRAAEPISVKSPRSPDSAVSETNMTAVERLKARLAKKSSDKSLSTLDRSSPVEAPPVETAVAVPVISPIPETHAVENTEAPATSTISTKNPKKSLQIDANAPVTETPQSSTTSVTDVKISPEKKLRKPLTVDAQSEPIPVPVPASVPNTTTPISSTAGLIPTPRTRTPVDSVGSFSAAIAQALPSPAARGSITGVSPPQKLLGNNHPPSPGGRYVYRTPGAPSPAQRASKTFDFLDTVMSTMSAEPQDDDSDNTHSPVANVNVEPLTKTRRSTMGASPSSEFSATPAQSAYLSASPGSLDDTSGAIHNTPPQASTHVPLGIASMGKKNTELQKASELPVVTEEKTTNDVIKPPLVQNTISSVSSMPDDIASETSSVAGDTAPSAAKPGMLSKKSSSSFSKSMKSMFGLKKKEKNK